MIVGASVVSKRFRSKARKGGANLYKDSRVRRVISNLTKNSKGAMASQGAKAGVRETGSEVGSDDDSQITLNNDSLYYSIAPPFVEWRSAQDAEENLNHEYNFGQSSEKSLSFDYLTEDIFAQIFAFLFGGVGVGVLSENVFSKSLTLALAGLNLKIFEKSIRAKRFGPKFRKVMRFIRKNGKNHFTFIGSQLGAFVVSAYSIYAIQNYLNDVINENRSEEYEDFKKKNLFVYNIFSGERSNISVRSEQSLEDDFFVTKKLKEYLRFRKKDLFETKSVSSNNVEQINVHNKIQDLITLFSELVSVKIFKINDVSISLSKKLQVLERQNFLCTTDTQGTLRPISHDLIFDDVFDTLLLNENVEKFDDEFKNVFLLLEDEILWVRNEILEIKKSIKSKSIASEELLLSQIKRIEKDFNKSLDPEVQLFASVFHTTSEIVTESRSLKAKSFVCGHYPYIGITSSQGSYKFDSLKK